MDTTLIFIGSGCLVCLMPLAIYLLYLSYLNGRATPAMVAGAWDFAAVLLGLSGFILLTGPLLISLIDSTWRTYAFGGWASLKGVSRREAQAGSIMAVGYLILLGTGITTLLRMRRRVTAIYNVAGASVESSLIGILEEHGYPWRRNHGELEIGIKKAAEPPEPFARFYPHETARVRVNAFPSLGNATLKWSGNWHNMRSEIEGALIRILTPHALGRNPVAGWLFTAAMTIMIIMLLWLVVLIYLVLTPAHG